MGEFARKTRRLIAFFRNFPIIFRNFSFLLNSLQSLATQNVKIWESIGLGILDHPVNKFFKKCKNFSFPPEDEGVLTISGNKNQAKSSFIPILGPIQLVYDDAQYLGT
jgi:hypothetical protein